MGGEYGFFFIVLGPLFLSPLNGIVLRTLVVQISSSDFCYEIRISHRVTVLKLHLFTIQCAALRRMEDFIPYPHVPG